MFVLILLQCGILHFFDIYNIFFKRFFFIVHKLYASRIAETHLIFFPIGASLHLFSSLVRVPYSEKVKITLYSSAQISLHKHRTMHFYILWCMKIIGT
jgi:hypothetical protein